MTNSGGPIQANPWGELPTEPPFVLAEDAAHLDAEYVQRADLKLDHLPVPFLGDPRSAALVLLNLNPGWVPETDTYERGDYATENRRSLTYQSRTPFFGLDPAFESIPGYRWWYRRLRVLIERVGMEAVVRRVACVEWFPYHSAVFKRPPRILPSQHYGFDLVAGAARRGAVIVLMRSRALWMESVPGLASAEVLELRVPRSPYLTLANLGAEAFKTVCEAVSGAKQPRWLSTEPRRSVEGDD